MLPDSAFQNDNIDDLWWRGYGGLFLEIAPNTPPINRARRLAILTLSNPILAYGL